MNITGNRIAAEQFNTIDMRIGLNGYLEADSEWKSDNMSIPFSKLYFITKGKGIVVSGGKTTELCAGKVYLIPYGLTHSFRCDEYMEKLYFHISIRLANGCDMFENCGRLLCRGMDLEEILHLKDLYFSKRTDCVIELKEKLYGTVCEFYRELSENDIQVYSEMVDQIMIYIRSHLSIRLSVQDISSALFISESKLSKAFSSEVGLSIGKYIDKAVMTKAQQLLIRSDLSIKAISEKLGFCDQFYFSRKFRQYYSTTPLQYRKMHNRI